MIRSVFGLHPLISILIVATMACRPHVSHAQSMLPSFKGTPQPLNSVQFSSAVDLEVDPSGNIFILDQGAHSLFKLDPNGNLVSQIGGFGSDGDLFNQPRSIQVTALDIYLADYLNNRVVRYDQNLNRLSQFTSRWDSPYDFEQVLDVAVSSQQDLFILDEREQKLIKFDRFTQPSVVFGGQSDPLGQLLDPQQLVLGPDNRLYIPDPAQDCIQVFDYFGNYLRSIQFAELKADRLHWGDDQNLYILDISENSVWVSSPQFKLLGQLVFPQSHANIKDIQMWRSSTRPQNWLYVLEENTCYRYPVESVSATKQ